MTELVRAKRLGWDETNGGVTATDILDPYDYADDDLEGELVKIDVNTPYLKYTNYIVNGQVADPNTIESIDAVAASANESANTGGMIALIPSKADGDRLVLPGGELQEELHLTLWFLGDASQYDAATRDAYAQAIQDEVTTNGIGPVTCMAFGVNYWNPAGDSPAMVLAVGDSDEPYLEDIRGLTAEAMVSVPTVPFGDIADAQHSPWVPHVTIAYSNDITILPELEARLGPITFDRIRLAFGDETKDIVLSGKRAILPTSDGSYA